MPPRLGGPSLSSVRASRRALALQSRPLAPGAATARFVGGAFRRMTKRPVRRRRGDHSGGKTWWEAIGDGGWIALDVDVAAVMPYVTAAVAAYGSAVIDKVSDQASDASASAAAGLGRRLLARILRGARAGHAEAALLDLAEEPQDADRVATVRRQIQIALEAEPALVGELAQMLVTAGVNVSAQGVGSVSVQHNAGIIQTGPGAQASQGRR